VGNFGSRNWKSGRRFVALLSCTVIGCSGAEEPPDSVEDLTTERAQQALVAGVAPAPATKRVYVGKLPDVTPEIEAAMSETISPPYDFTGHGPGFQMSEPADVVEIDFTTRSVHAVTLDKDKLRAVAEVLEQRGLAQPGEPPVVEDSDGELSFEAPGSTLQGWSNGVDSRVKKNISTVYPANHSQLRRIGLVKLDLVAEGMSPRGVVGFSGAGLSRPRLT
jgi:hypothetical protein